MANAAIKIQWIAGNLQTLSAVSLQQAGHSLEDLLPAKKSKLLPEQLNRLEESAIALLLQYRKNISTKAARRRLIVEIDRLSPLPLNVKIKLGLNQFFGSSDKTLKTHFIKQNKLPIGTDPSNEITQIFLAHTLKKRNSLAKKKKATRISRNMQELRIFSDQLTIRPEQIACNEFSSKTVEKLQLKYVAAMAEHDREAYQRARYTFHYFLTHPYRASYKSLWFGTFLSDPSIDKHTFRLIKTLHQLFAKNRIKRGSIERKFIEELYDKHFSEENPQSGKEKLNQFNNEIIELFKELLEFKVSNELNNRDTLRYQIALDTLHKKLAPFSRHYSLAGSLSLQKTAKENLYLHHQEKKHYYRKEKMRALKKRAATYLSYFFTLGNACIQVLLATFALLTFQINPVLTGFIAVAMFYASIYQFRNENKTFWQRLLGGKHFFFGFQNPLGKLYALAIFSLAALMSLTTTAIFCGLILTFPAMPFIAGCILLAPIALFVVTSYTALMYVSMMKLSRFVSNISRSIFEAVKKHGPFDSIKIGISSLKKNWVDPLSSLEKKMHDEAQQKQLARKKRIEMLAFSIIYPALSIVGLGLFLLSTIATLGTWQLEIALFSRVYLHTSVMLSNVISYFLVFTAPTILYPLFNLESFLVFSKFISEVVSGKIITPLVQMITGKIQLHHTIANGFKRAAKTFVNFFKDLPNDPWSSLFPVMKAVKHVIFDIPAFVLFAIGSSLLAIGGAPTLSATLHLPLLPARVLTFLSETISAAAWNMSITKTNIESGTPKGIHSEQPCKIANQEAKDGEKQPLVAEEKEEALQQQPTEDRASHQVSNEKSPRKRSVTPVRKRYSPSYFAKENQEPQTPKRKNRHQSIAPAQPLTPSQPLTPFRRRVLVR